MGNIKFFKNIYDKLGNDYLRGAALTAAQVFKIRKDVIRMDTNCVCNIRCIMCNMRPLAGASPYMSFSQYQRIIDMFSDTTRMLYLSCAYEPLITPKFYKYLEYAKQKGIPHISFCTNGLLIDDKLIETLVKYEIDEIIISFNGFCKADYNRIMKGSDFDKVSANLKKLADYKKEFNAQKPRIRLNTVLLKSNLMHFDEMLKFVNNNDIDCIQFRELILFEDINDRDEVKKELPENQTQDEYIRIVEKIRNVTQLFQNCGKELILPKAFLHPALSSTNMEAAEEISAYPSPSKQESQPDDKKWTIQKRKNTKKHRCSIPLFSHWIDYKGTVRVCGYDNNGIIGNALSDSPKLLAKNKKRFQRQALSGKCKNQNCSTNIDTSIIV